MYICMYIEKIRICTDICMKLFNRVVLSFILDKNQGLVILSSQADYKSIKRC